MAGKLFLSWNRPTQKQQQTCAATAGDFNYDSTLRGSSFLLPDDKDLQHILSKNGFFINQSRVLLGNGPFTYSLAKSALLTWRHFGLKWAFVDEQTMVEKGRRFCACVREFVPWVMMPLQIAYVADVSVQPQLEKGIKAYFGFGSGTLQGHLLAGEERFSVYLDEKDEVWYEILSFSKPAHILSAIGYPYVRLRQKYFALQSTEAMVKYVTSLKPKIEDILSK